MNNNLTWKISTGVLALALVTINVVMPAYETRQAVKNANKVVEFLSGYETAPKEQQQIMLKNAMQHLREVSTPELDARAADITTSNGATTSGGCDAFLDAYNSFWHLSRTISIHNLISGVITSYTDEDRANFANGANNFWAAYVECSSGALAQ